LHSLGFLPAQRAGRTAPRAPRPHPCHPSAALPAPPLRPLTASLLLSSRTRSQSCSRDRWCGCAFHPWDGWCSSQTGAAGRGGAGTCVQEAIVVSDTNSRSEPPLGLYPVPAFTCCCGFPFPPARQNRQTPCWPLAPPPGARTSGHVDRLLRRASQLLLLHDRRLSVRHARSERLPHHLQVLGRQVRSRRRGRRERGGRMGRGAAASA
jgi:hypothetical protein